MIPACVPRRHVSFVTVRRAQVPQTRMAAVLRGGPVTSGSTVWGAVPDWIARSGWNRRQSIDGFTFFFMYTSSSSSKRHAFSVDNCKKRFGFNRLLYAKPPGQGVSASGWIRAYDPRPVGKSASCSSAIDRTATDSEQAFPVVIHNCRPSYPHCRTGGSVAGRGATCRDAMLLV